MGSSQAQALCQYHDVTLLGLRLTERFEKQGMDGGYAELLAGIEGWVSFIVMFEYDLYHSGMRYV